MSRRDWTSGRHLACQAKGAMHRQVLCAIWPTLVFLGLCAIVVTAGCYGDSTKGEVTGSVTIDGQPCKTGSVAFISVDGNSGTAGAQIVDGQFSAQVPFGLMKVEIRVSKVVGEKKLYDTPDSPVQPIMEEVLPEKYNDETELTIDVGPGKNHKIFDLTTK
jgi:hypothetical protein